MYKRFKTPRRDMFAYPQLINHIISYPAPTSLNLNYSAGSLAGASLVIQIITGLCLSMHYIPLTSFAFESVEHIMRDVVGGALLRYGHANGASFFFFVVYWHLARSLYYRSYIKNSLAWYVGVGIFFAMMATAFIGYVLPWGQMSFWGATVITNLFSVIPVIGQDVVYWLWGGFGVAAPTLNRFYSLHFLVPFIVLALVIFHILALHNEGSSSPHVNNHSVENISFGTYYTLKDVVGVFVFLILFCTFLLLSPNTLNHPDNYIPANPMQTPPHIVPEWYFLPFYAMLRAVPDKGLGVVVMAGSILFLLMLPGTATFKELFSTAGAPSLFHKVTFWVFITVTISLGFLGGAPIFYPYNSISVFLTAIYFSYVPVLCAWSLYTNQSDTRELDQKI